MLYSRDATLLNTDASEWAVTHRLAVYVEAEFPGWNIDCEYNRQGVSEDIKRRADGSGVRPDIIVHHRGFVELEHNLLAIEIKKGVGGKDCEKVKEYTAAPIGTRKFQYQFGLALTLEGDGGFHWFENGQAEDSHTDRSP